MMVRPDDNGGRMAADPELYHYQLKPRPGWSAGSFCASCWDDDATIEWRKRHRAFSRVEIDRAPNGCRSVDEMQDGPVFVRTEREKHEHLDNFMMTAGGQTFADVAREALLMGIGGATTCRRRHKHNDWCLLTSCREYHR